MAERSNVCNAIIPIIEIDEYTTEMDEDRCDGDLDENLVCTKCGKRKQDVQQTE